MEKRMIIVGAGIAGLSTGCYAQMNGYRTILFELHDIPGGLCTAWTRKGYTFDISMHMVTNSKNGPFKKMWDELEVTKDQEFFYHNSLVTVEGKEGKLDFCLDRNRLEKQMLDISPADATLIKEFNDLFFGKSIVNYTTIEPKELKTGFSNLIDILRLLPMFGVFRKYGNKTLQEYLGGFKNRFLARAIQCVVDTPGWPMPRYPMVALAGFAKGGGSEAGYPLGGSKRVAFKLAEYYKKLGGEIYFNSRVNDVILDNNVARGIKLADGSMHHADTIVWAGDGHHLIFDILGGRYMDEKIREMYEEWLVVKPMVHVCIGVNMDLSAEPQKMVYELENPIRVADKEFKWITIMIHAFDKTTSPKGKSSLEVWYATEFKYWEELKKDRSEYIAEKKRIARETIEALEKKWPGFSSKVEVTDVPTPMTYVRYTANWQGSVDGWYITPENMMKQQMKRTLPGLDNLYMAGQWTAPFTGTVIAALSGRQLVQVLCRKHKRHFNSAPLERKASIPVMSH